MAYNPTNWQNLPSTTTAIASARLNNMETGIKNATDNISKDEYDSTKTYSIGDICVYNNKLYKCIETISTAENFDSSKWEETQLSRLTKRVIAQYQTGQVRSYSDGATILFTEEILNNSNGDIVFNNDGTITINKDGFISVSFLLWITGDTDCRPWLHLGRTESGIFKDWVNVIDDISSGYVTLSANNVIIPVNTGDVFQLKIFVQNQKSIRVDGDSGSTSSYMQIEFI